MEYIDRLNESRFVHGHENLIIWGTPGIGNTCMGKAIATKACQEGSRIRWIM